MPSQNDSTPNLARNRGLPGMVFVGRFTVGMAVAVSAVADVSYLAEIAPRGLRGAMVSTNELAISIGMLAAFFTGHMLRNMRGKDVNHFTPLELHPRSSGQTTWNWCGVDVAMAPTKVNTRARRPRFWKPAHSVNRKTDRAYLPECVFVRPHYHITPFFLPMGIQHICIQFPRRLIIL